MKNILKLSLKLLFSFIATSVIAFISMLMCLSADIDFAFKLLLSALFMVFILYLGFNVARNKGEDDSKANVFKTKNGFIAGGICMIPAIIVAILYMVLTFKGWDGANRVLADGIYMILYLMFLSFTPLLSVFTSFNPALSIDFAQPAITVLKNIGTPNAVFAPLYFIPIILFVLAAGFGYILGHKERKSLIDSVNKIKNSKEIQN